MNTRAPKALARALLPAVLASGLLASGCAAVAKAGREPANPEVLRHSNFWNLYRRGIARMKDRRWAEAAEDMERCLGRRAGAKFAYPFDLWRVRTYGLHITEHYFPHRELAVCLLELGRPLEARDLLLESLRQEPSARARHHLNLARERLVRDQDLPPPVIVPDAGDVLHSRTPEVELRGRARGEAFVAGLSVGGREQFLELAEREAAFRQTLSLPAGEHEVVLEARDLKGRVARRAVRVVVDPVAPQFHFARARREGAAWRITGVCADERGVVLLTRDGEALPGAGPAESRRVPVDLLLADGRDAVLSATDRAGNTLEARVRGDILPRLLARRAEPLAGAAWAAVGDLPAPAPGPAAPPALALDGLHALNVTYDDHFFLSGTVDDAGGLAALRVQGADVLQPAAAPSRLVRFGCFVPVRPGANDLALVAVGADGRETAATVRVERREPAFAQPALRLAATLPPLDRAERLEGWFPAQDLLLNALVDRPAPFQPRFQVLARGADLVAALAELRLSLSDLVDDRARVPYRRLASTDLFLNGEVLEEPGGFTVRLHTVSAEDGLWLGADDVYLDRASADPAAQLRGLAAKVERRFPVVQGRLAEDAGRTLRLPVGTESGLIPGARLLLIRPGPDGSPASGALVRGGDAPVQLLVTRATPGQAVARVQGAGERPRAGDWFHSR